MPPSYRHEVLSVPISDDEMHIVDIAGAQFGNYRAVTPFEQYAESVIKRFESHAHGYEAARQARRLPKEGEKCTLGHGMQDLRIYVTHDNVVKIMNESIGEWEAEAGKSVGAMLNQKKELYERDRDDFLQEIGAEMVEFAEWVKEQPDQTFPLVKRQSMQASVVTADDTRPNGTHEAADWVQKKAARYEANGATIYYF